MYSGYSPSPSHLTNPFVSDPTNAQGRFPDISGSSSPDPNAAQFTSWMQPGGSQQQQQQQLQQQQQYPQQNQMAQQYSGGVGYNPTGMVSGAMSPHPGQFQPSSGFGQQMLGQINGSSYGYLQGQNTATSPQATYNPVQQQLQSPGYVPQFDPYASIGSGQWDGNGNGSGGNPPSAPQHQFSSSSSSFQSPTSPTSLTSPITTSRSATGGMHPREFIKIHKTEIEGWDTYAWKQLLNCFDDLKEAWGARKREVDGRAQQLLMQMQYGGGAFYGPQMQQETERLKSLSKEAESNQDSVAASSFQVHEVFQNYRSSGDAASKRRVREASNAALQSLPDWPAQGF